MSERYEWTGCPAAVSLAAPGTVVGDDQVTGYALVVGDPQGTALVVESATLAGLAVWLQDTLDRVDAALADAQDVEDAHQAAPSDHQLVMVVDGAGRLVSAHLDSPADDQ